MSQGHYSEIEMSFGDGEHSFAMPWKQLEELEEKLGIGVFAVFGMLRHGQDFRAVQLAEIIRLGLIGGGMPPLDALKMVERYVHARPIMESMIPALAILEAALFGNEAKAGEA